VSVSDDKLGAITACPAHEPCPRRLDDLHRHPRREPGRLRGRQHHQHRDRHRCTHRHGSLGAPATSQLTVDITGQAPALTIVKSSDHPSYTVGDTITYSYKVTNTGNVTINNIVVNDDKLGIITCPDTSLAEGTSMTCTITHVAQASEVGNLTNNVTLTGEPTGGSLDPASDSLTVVVNAAPPAPAPALTIVKSSDHPSYTVGDTITYSYKVTNTGNVTINNIVVNDDKLGIITCPDTSLAEGTSMTCTITHVAQASEVGNLTNHVTLTGDPTGGSLDPASDSLTVVVNAAPPAPAPARHDHRQELRPPELHRG
jgi:hypothetical protein